MRVFIAGVVALVVIGCAAPSMAACVHHPHRSLAVKQQFWRMTGYPHGRPGYVVDHIIPLCLGGKDAASNMQWQTITAAKAKDVLERAACRRACHVSQ